MSTQIAFKCRVKYPFPLKSFCQERLYFNVKPKMIKKTLYIAKYFEKLVNIYINQKESSGNMSNE